MTTAELETDLVVLPDSDEAASYQSVDGWVSRRGHFYGEEEQVARWAGATHVRCEDCGSPVKKRGLTVCVDCWEKRDTKRWEAMPRKEWDGEQMVFSQVLDEFFSTPGDALDEAECLGLDSDVDLRLVLCDPVHLRRLEIEDFADDLPEGGESPDWLVDAIDEFNEATDGKDPVCWRDGKFAMASAGQQEEEEEEEEPTHFVHT